MKVQVELRSTEAFKCMTAIKDMQYYDQRIILSVEHQEAYATDGFGIVISPATIQVTQDPTGTQRELPKYMILKLSNIKVPKNAERIAIIVNDWFDDNAVNPIVTSRAEPVGFATVARDDTAPNVRAIIPKKHHLLPAAPPQAFNPEMAMKVLKGIPSVSKANYGGHAIKLGAGAAFLWSLENDGEFILMSLKGDVDSERVFWQLVNERNGGKQ